MNKLTYDRERLYGDCTNNPTKVTMRSAKTAETGQAGKGDWKRPLDQMKWEDGYGRIFGKKKRKNYFGEEYEV